jgi:hypothetical protein
LEVLANAGLQNARFLTSTRKKKKKASQLKAIQPENICTDLAACVNIQWICSRRDDIAFLMLHLLKLRASPAVDDSLTTQSRAELSLKTALN